MTDELLEECIGGGHNITHTVSLDFFLFFVVFCCFFLEFYTNRKNLFSLNEYLTLWFLHYLKYANFVLN